MGDHAALLSELIPLVDERFQAALRAGIADIGRLDKMERLEIYTEPAWFRGGGRKEEKWRAYSRINRRALYAHTMRAAIDGVPE